MREAHAWRRSHADCIGTDRHNRAAAALRINGTIARAPRIFGDKLVVTTDGGELGFDAVYPALGVRVASLIAQDLGARLNREGYLHVDEHQRTDVPGLPGNKLAPVATVTMSKLGARIPPHYPLHVWLHSV